MSVHQCTERHGDNVQFHKVNESEKKTLRFQAKRHKQKFDSFVVILTSKFAALKWQELEYIPPVNA